MYKELRDSLKKTNLGEPTRCAGTCRPRPQEFVQGANGDPASSRRQCPLLKALERKCADSAELLVPTPKREPVCHSEVAQPALVAALLQEQLHQRARDRVGGPQGIVGAIPLKRPPRCTRLVPALDPHFVSLPTAAPSTPRAGRLRAEPGARGRGLLTGCPQQRDAGAKTQPPNGLKEHDGRTQSPVRAKLPPTKPWEVGAAGASIHGPTSPPLAKLFGNYLKLFRVNRNPLNPHNHAHSANSHNHTHSRVTTPVDTEGARPAQSALPGPEAHAPRTPPELRKRVRPRGST